MGRDHKCQTFEKDGCPTRSKTALVSNLCAHSPRVAFSQAAFRLEMRGRCIKAGGGENMK